MKYRHLFSLSLKAVLIAFLFIFLIFAIVHLQSEASIHERKNLPKKYTAIVLGAGLTNEETPSLIFRDRIDVAVNLYSQGYVTAVLISGDDGSLFYNEVTPAREYMLQKGVPSDAIFLDHAGFDTYSTMYRAKEIFLVDSAIIVTQSFHLPRAIFIAKNLGINAVGAPADMHGYRFSNVIREILANCKAFLDILIHRKPKYLGPEIPITGDSSPSI